MISCKTFHSRETIRNFSVSELFALFFVINFSLLNFYVGFLVFIFVCVIPINISGKKKIQIFSSFARPLYDLLKKTVSGSRPVVNKSLMQWGEKHQVALE